MSPTSYQTAPPRGGLLLIADGKVCGKRGAARGPGPSQGRPAQSTILPPDVPPTTPDPATPRTAFVTGGARGIGRAICEALAADGHRVAVADLLPDETKQTAEAIDGIAVHADVTDAASIHQAVTNTELEFGPVEILVNNAGWDQLIPFLDTDEEFWDRVIDINFKGALRTCRRVVPEMVDAGYGRIVNIGSDAARVGSSLEAVYSGAKGGVISFTKTLARETARYGVTANVVCPGPTDTPMLQEMLAAGGSGEKVLEGMKRAVPMRRLAQPHEIAVAVAFLASDRAGFVTGQTLSVSGGLTMA
jgi:2-hydroxycyclohexanecarboxyl-CoA dehydrogenase